jgi:hypothetical protein
VALQEVKLGWSNKGTRTMRRVYKYIKKYDMRTNPPREDEILSGYFSKENPGSAFLQDEPGFNII